MSGTHTSDSGDGRDDGEGDRSPSLTTYVKESFASWAHPWKEQIPWDEVIATYSLFIPMPAFSPAAVGFRDRTRAPDMMSSSDAYCTALQVLGEVMRFLPDVGSSKGSSNFQLTRKSGETVTIPKAHFLLNLVVKDTSPAIGDSALDIFSEHELVNPENLLGICAMIVVRDPEVELIDLLIRLVAENAYNKPPERRAYLQEEIKSMAALPSLPPAAAQAGDGSDSRSGEAEEDNSRGGNGGGRAKQQQQQKSSSSSSSSICHRSSQPKNDPMDKYCTFQDVDELWRAVALLVDTATGTTTVEGSRKYTGCRAELLGLIRGDIRDADNNRDENVHLEEMLGLTATVARINAYAASIGAHTTSEQLVYNEYKGVKEVDWQPWMAQPPAAGAAAAADGVADEDEDEQEEEDADGDGDASEFEDPLGVPTPPLTPAPAPAPAPAPPPPAAALAPQQPAAALAPHPAKVRQFYFRSPAPSLTWELSPQQASARRMMRVTFPWKRSDAGSIFASIAARYLGIKMADVLRLAHIGGTRTRARAAAADGFANAGRTAQTIGLRHVGGGACVDSEALETEADWSPYPTLGVDVVVSRLRPLGRKANAIKTVVREYVAKRAADIRKEIDTIESGDVPMDDESRARVEKQVADKTAELKDVRTSGFVAIREIEQAALYEMATLLETGCGITNAVRACSMWVNRHEDMTLDYEPTFRNVGVLGQLVGSMMLDFKKYGIATGQWPLLFLMIARDTGYIAHLAGWLPICPAIHGGYGSGKSRITGDLSRLSLKCSVTIITGASSQGLLPIYANPSNPEGDDMKLLDEAHPMMTATRRHLPFQDQKAQSELTAWITMGMLDHMTNEKGDDGRIHMRRKIVESNTPLGFCTNADTSGNSIEARMVTVFLPANVPGPRNAMNIMCNEETASGKDAGVRESIELTMTKHQAHTMIVGKGMEAGGLPLPNAEEFYMNMGKVVEFMRERYPEYARRIRKVDSARPFASVLSMWVAEVLAYARGFQPLDASGAAVESRAISEPYELTRLPEDVAGYLCVDQDVTFYVIGWVVYNCCDPEASDILRWISETIGNYPFVGSCKDTMREEEEKPPHTYSGTDDAAPVAPDARVRLLPDVVRELRSYRFCGIINLPTDLGRRGSGAQALPAGSRKRRRDAFLASDQAMTPDERDLRDYDETEGPTVTLTMEGKSGTKRNLREASTAVMSGAVDPKYEYKREKVLIDAESGKSDIFYNPNYILVNGNDDALAELYIRAHPGTKMTTGHVRELLAGLAHVTMQARMLPLVPKERRKVLLEIEGLRAHLWMSMACKLVTAPVVIPCRRGYYVLIEALLDSPKNITFKVLRMLCNETTVERDVIMPITYRRYPEICKVFHAKPVPRKLMSANPGHMGSQADSLPRETREQIALSGSQTRDAVLSWGQGSELRSMKNFFRQNGINKNPSDFTYAKVFESRVLARQRAAENDPGRVFKSYPYDLIREDQKLDREAKMLAH